MTRLFKIIVVAAIAFCTAESNADAQLLNNLLKKATSSDATETITAATSNGRQAGAALKSLYAQYKADGKLDMSNLNNMLNLATLATNIKGLKGQSSKTAFYKDFATGLITGSDNLVTNKNSSGVMSGLTSLVNNVDLSGLTNATSSAKGKAADALSALSGKTGTALENANEIASSVSNILNLFK